MDIECDIALAAVGRASALCEAVRRATCGTDAITKEDRSPVTVADFGAQALIIHALHQAFPSDPVVAEEDASLLHEDDALRERVWRFVQSADPSVDRQAMLDALAGGGAAGGARGRFWTIDPIDGTKGFIRGDQYAVALALIEDGQVQLGVLGCPYLGDSLSVAADASRGQLFHALRGGGAWCQPLAGGAPMPVRVSRRADPAAAVFCESVESGHTAQGLAGSICSALGTVAAPARLDSQCKYAVTARGEADVYLRLPTRTDYEEKIWDHAAGMLLVEEAGGRVSDIHGQPLDFTQGRTLSRNKGIVATNGLLHEAVLAAIAAALTNG
jgi:3'(2'), 5'-bisphosphate nucleotidase